MSNRAWIFSDLELNLSSNEGGANRWLLPISRSLVIWIEDTFNNILVSLAGHSKEGPAQRHANVTQLLGRRHRLNRFRESDMTTKQTDNFLVI